MTWSSQQIPPDVANAVLGSLVAAARAEPDGRLAIRDGSGVVVAVVQAHVLPRRPRDVPRALRPKGRLSKRQRDAAKREKRGAAVGVSAPV